MTGFVPLDARNTAMMTHLKTSFAWQVATGFVLGVVGMVALQPADATRTLVGHFAPVHATR